MSNQLFVSFGILPVAPFVQCNLTKIAVDENGDAKVREVKVKKFKKVDAMRNPASPERIAKVAKLAEFYASQNEENGVSPFELEEFAVSR